MKIIQEEREKIMILHISGCMVADTIRPLKEAFELSLKGGVNRIVLNLKHVRLADSAGISAMAFMLGQCRTLKIVGVRGHVAKIFKMVGLDKVVEISFCNG